MSTSRAQHRVLLLSAWFVTNSISRTITEVMCYLMFPRTLLATGISLWITKNNYAFGRLRWAGHGHSTEKFCIVPSPKIKRRNTKAEICNLRQFSSADIRIVFFRSCVLMLSFKLCLGISICLCLAGFQPQFWIYSCPLMYVVYEVLAKFFVWAP
jgi:hypothetical protein